MRDEARSEWSAVPLHLVNMALLLEKITSEQIER